MVLIHISAETKTGALKIATETSGIALTIGHTTSETTVADNLTVTGNLTVSGTTTTVNSTNLSNGYQEWCRWWKIAGCR